MCRILFPCLGWKVKKFSMKTSHISKQDGLLGGILLKTLWCFLVVSQSTKVLINVQGLHTSLAGHLLLLFPLFTHSSHTSVLAFSLSLAGSVLLHSFCNFSHSSGSILLLELCMPYCFPPFSSLTNLTCSKKTSLTS